MTNSVENQATLEIQVAKIDNEDAQTTSARNLHTKLEIKKDFTNWIKYQIERFELVEGRDYTVFNDLRSPILASANPENAAKPEKQASKVRVQKTAEYQLTSEIAKLIAASSNTKQGNRIREYLVAVESDFRRLQNAQIESRTEHRMKLEYSAEASAIRGTSPTYDIGRKLIQSTKKAKPGKPWPPEVVAVFQMAQRQARELQRLLENFDPDSVVDFEDDHAYANIEFEIKNAHRLQVSREGTPRLKH